MAHPRTKSKAGVGDRLTWNQAMGILAVTDYKLAALLALKHLSSAGQGFVTRESVMRLRERLDAGEPMPK